MKMTVGTCKMSESSQNLPACQQCTHGYYQGSCASLEFKASLEKSLNFRKLKMALNCFGKEWKALKSLEFVYRESFNKTW